MAEACAFGVPDDKYGEIVGAVVVPKGQVASAEAFVKDVQNHAATKLASFKVWWVERWCRCWGAQIAKGGGVRCCGCMYNTSRARVC